MPKQSPFMISGIDSGRTMKPDNDEGVNLKVDDSITENSTSFN